VNAPLPLLERPLDRWVLLRTAEARAALVPTDRRARVVELHEAARARIDAALGEHGVAALVLVRAAIPLLLEALLVAHAVDAPSPGLSASELWGRFDEAVEAARVRALPPALKDAREHSLSASLDLEIAAHGEPRIEEALSLAAFLSDATEIRSPRAIRVQRGIRAALLIGAALLLMAELVAHRPKSRNLALHASVIASSRRPNYGPTQDLVNGTIEPSVAFATKDEADPWVTIDLGSAARVSEVTLVNSIDHQDDALPIRIETSADGAAWDAAGLATAHFTPDAPAVVSFTKRSARFVRLHARPGGAFYLNEVEVR
jgi:hypothetical protein